MAHVETRQRGTRLVHGCLFAQALVERAEGDIFHHGRAEQLIVGILEKIGRAQAHLAKVVLVAPQAAEGLDGSSARFVQADEAAQERGRASAIRADDGETLAGVQVHIDPVEHAGAVAVHAHAVESDQAGHMRRSQRPRPMTASAIAAMKRTSACCSGRVERSGNFPEKPRQRMASSTRSARSIERTSSMPVKLP